MGPKNIFVNPIYGNDFKITLFSNKCYPQCFNEINLFYM